MVTFNYVKSNTGDYAVQLVDDYGYFCILTDDLTYPQGIGWATQWDVVDPSEIPEDVRKELDYAIDGYMDYLKFMECLECQHN